jgi:hypothetical protein
MMETMRDIVAGDGSRPIPARLHVGPVAFELIKALAPYPAPVGLASHLYGVPIVVGSLNTALPLDERGWRLVDAEGNVITEGVFEE